MISLARACRARFRRFADGPERGMSLTELLVGSMVTVVVLTAATGLYISAMRTVSTAGAVNANTANASNGMNELARVIRAGTTNPVMGQALDNPAFLEAKPESLILYSYVMSDPAVPQPVMTHFHLNAQRQLVEDRWAAITQPGGYWAFPSPYPGSPGYTAPQSTRILTTTVPPRAGTSAELFTYYSNVKGTALLADPGMAVAAASLSAIVAVKVSLTVQQSMTDGDSPVALVNLVGIPNLDALDTVT